MITRSFAPALLCGCALLLSGCDNRKTTEQLAAVAEAQKQVNARLSEQTLRIADLEAETKRLRRQVADLEEKLNRAAAASKSR